MQHTKWLSAVLAVSLLSLASCPAQDEQKDGSGPQLDLVVNARPASLLVDVQGKKFGVAGNTLSQVFIMPNVDMGVGIELDQLYLDATVGAGMILNDGFRSFLLQASVAATFSVSQSFTVGPRVGLVYLLGPEWTQDDSVDFDPAPGFLAGVQMALGDRISYIVSVDLLSVSLDANGNNGVVPDSDNLDMVGLAFQFGVRGEF